MKWTMLSLAIAGTVTYAVIFFAQSQHEPASSRAGVQIAPSSIALAEPEDPTHADEALATLDPVAVSNEATPEAEEIESLPAWEGKAWPAGVDAFERGDYELAQAALEVAVEENETSPYRHYLLGLTYRKVGENAAAISEIRRSLELAPGTVRALVALARVQLDEGDTLAAREAIDSALDSDLEHADSWHVLGRIELEEGNLEEAATAFRKATDRAPDHVWAHNNLGYVRILQERFDEAVEPLTVAVASGREEAVFYNNLGVALERIGEPQLAAIAFGKASMIGHGPAEESFERLEQILVARGESVPGADELDALDGRALVAQLEREQQPSEVVLDETAAASEFAEFEDR